ncbi:Endo-1,4-beta-xylanase A [Cucumis melo var. makuwa]|uniref:Endo-1,4-beta-xylanase A n=1 Tax=Cucumis melo var. makuwa TaxID=1194695 RepID=A0A5D3CYE2_CUCMM|nr:Endo-1,4-beta-xylanase A [Cucumis melo var. makuwa]TYK15189.1 Endo-1,4-beta-xylanase A [Cucumis melo var. makuwa]
MSSADSLGKAQRDRLAELEEQMLYLAEVPDSIRYLESHFEEISEKASTIDAVVGRVEGLPIQELLVRVDTLETNTNVRRTINYERVDSSSGFAAHMEEHVSELDSSQKTLLEMINDMSEDFRATLDVVRNEIADVNARLSLTICQVVVEVPIHGHTERALHNRYLGRPDERTPLAILLQECGNPCSAKAKFDEHRVQHLTSAYAATERLFDLTSDSQDVRRHQSSSPGRNRNSRLSSPKAVGGDECPGKDCRPYQSNIENTWQRPNNRNPPKRPLSCFICGRPHLARECPNKVDFHSLQASLIANSDDKSNQAEGEVGQIDEGEKTRIGAIKYLSSLKKKSGERNVSVERGLLYVDTWINQKQTKSTMIDSSATHNFITEAEARRLRLRWEKDSRRMKAEPPSAAILLGTLGKLGETILKDTLWVLEKCHAVMPNSWPKSLSMRRTIDHGIELLPEAKASAKNAYRMAPPELAKL